MDEVRIKKGNCVFGTDRVMLEETLTGYFTNMLDMWKDGDRSQKTVFAASVFTVFFSLSFIFNFLMAAQSQQILVFAGGMVAILLVSWAHKFENGFTTDKFVQRESIKSVSFIEGKKWITCPRFILEYEKDGEEKKRYVMMPTHLLPGVDEDIEELKKKFDEMEVETSW